jgi:hypothetical protein
VQGVIGLGLGTWYASEKEADWLLYKEAAPTCYGPLECCHVQEMWTGRGNFLRFGG